MGRTLSMEGIKHGYCYLEANFIMRRGCEGPVCTLTTARSLAFQAFLPFWASDSGQEALPCPSAWTGWWQPSISTEDLAMPQARRRHLARKSRKEWTGREINPQSLPIPYKINTKLPEIHTNVNEIQNTKLLSTTQLPKYYWPWQDGLSLNQTMSPVTLKSQSVTELSQWGGVHPSGPLRGPCLSPLPSKPSLLKVGSTDQQHRYYLGAC